MVFDLSVLNREHNFRLVFPNSINRVMPARLTRCKLFLLQVYKNNDHNLNLLYCNFPAVNGVLLSFCP